LFLGVDDPEKQGKESVRVIVHAWIYKNLYCARSFATQRRNQGFFW
jgi:hypothetical protein